MIITLCGSARFEAQYHYWNKRLTLEGHTVFSLSVFPSTKDWYDEKVKLDLDAAHLRKIALSDAVVIITDTTSYVGESTLREMDFAFNYYKMVFVTRETSSGPTLERVQTKSAIVRPHGQSSFAAGPASSAGRTRSTR